MSDKLSDAQCIEACKLLEKHGSQIKAAAAAGLGRAAFQQRLIGAKTRNLTAQTIIRDPAEKLKVENADLRRQLREAQREEETAAKIREEIWKIEGHEPNPPEWKFKAGANGFRGMPMLFASDWHYGEVVRKEEIGGLNEFNAEIAAKRIKRMTDTTIDLAFNHMGRANTTYPGIFLIYGGDMISGNIHEELAMTNDRTPQQCINDLTDLMAAQIETLVTKFGNIWIPCVTGNHGRSTKKTPYKNRVFTSHEWNIYCNLKRSFKGNKHVNFLIPEQTDARFDVYGHRYLLTHGDTLGVKGGDGIIGSIGPIRRGEIKIRNAESQINRDFDTLMMGHWHQELFLPGLIVNPCLKGYDEFARSALRAPYSRPAQLLWFTHPEHGITSRWTVYLEGLTHTDKPDMVRWTA